MARDVNITKFTTFWKVDKIPNVSFYKLTNALSTEDFFTKEKIPYAYFENDSCYRFPLIPEDKLLSMFNIDWLKPVISTVAPFPYRKTNREILMKNKPKDDVQAEVIDKAFKALTINKQNRVIISLKTGQGKTYVTTNLISKLGLKTIIFVKSITLRDQWYQSFKNHTNIKDLMVVTRSQDLIDLLETNEKVTPDVTIVVHRSMQNFIEATSEKDLGRLFIKLGIGIKVYDEFDLENASMFRIDCNTAIRCNIYLSATDFKSGKTEDRIFKMIFHEAVNIGKEYDPKVQRNAKFILYNSHPSKKEFGRLHVYGPEGPVFSYPKYHEYVVKKKAYYEGLVNLWDTFIKHRYYNEDNTLKTVFFIGRINTSEEFKKDLIDITGLSSKDISILNSETDKKWRNWAFSRKLIISTSDSLGRGVDLKGLDTVVDFETRNSLSSTTQVVGRVSRTGMKNVGTYIQFVDEGLPIPLKNYTTKLQSGFYNELFTKIEEEKCPERKLTTS